MTRSRSLRPVELPTTRAAVSAQLAQAPAVAAPDDIEVKNVVMTFTYRAKLDVRRLSRAYACEVSVETRGFVTWRFALELDGRRVVFIAFPKADKTNEYRIVCVGGTSTLMVLDAWCWLQSRVLSAFED